MLGSRSSGRSHSTYKKHGKRSALYKAVRKIEKAQAQMRAKYQMQPVTAVASCLAKSGRVVKLR